MPARSRPAHLGALLGTLLLAAGCGTTKAEPLQAASPEVPADLCALIPQTARAGLATNTNTDTTGNPTAACSLRSPDGSSGSVRAVVTWVQLDDTASAEDVLASQCRAMDPATYAVQPSAKIPGAVRACTGKGKSGDSATIAASNGVEVVTARVDGKPAGQADPFARATQMTRGVLAALAGATPSS